MRTILIPRQPLTPALGFSEQELKEAAAKAKATKQQSTSSKKQKTHTATGDGGGHSPKPTRAERRAQKQANANVRVFCSHMHLESGQPMVPVEIWYQPTIKDRCFLFRAGRGKGKGKKRSYGNGNQQRVEQWDRTDLVAFCQEHGLEEILKTVRKVDGAPV